MMEVFHDGDRVLITADHLVKKKCIGTINRWVHVDVYVVNFDDGAVGVIRGDEMTHLKETE